MKHTYLNRLIAMLVSVAMLCSFVPLAFAAEPSQFSDFPEGWSKEAMTFTVENGLIQGKTDTTIEPASNLTRAEMATIINRAFAAQITEDISEYTDVNSADWFYDEIGKAVNMETFHGDGNGYMRPNDFITREEVMTIIARALVLESDDYTAIEKFGDYSSVSEWAKPEISALIGEGYVAGYEDMTLRPQSNITREELVQLMYNIFKTYITLEGNYNKVSNPDCVMINQPGVTLSNVTIEGDLVLGDGVGSGRVNLKNVTIKGRLLVRGGFIKLENVTADKGVVVKNVNGRTHFYNWRSDKIFNGIKELTYTTYLTSTGGTVGSDSKEKYDVTFYYGVNETSPNAYVGQLDDIKSGSTVSKKDYEKLYTDKGIIFENEGLEGYTDGGETHMIYPELRYMDDKGKWNVFDEDTQIVSDMKVYYTFKYIQLAVDGKFLGVDLDNVSLYTYYESDTRFMDSLKDFMTISRNPINNGLKGKDAQIYKTIADKTGFIDEDGYILIRKFDLNIAEIIKIDEIEAEIKEYIQSHIGSNRDDVQSIVDMISDQDIEKLVNDGISVTRDDVVDYIVSVQSDDVKLNEISDRIVDKITGYDFYKDFIKCFENKKDTYTVDTNNLKFAKAVANAIKGFKSDDIIARLRKNGYSAFIDLCGEDKFAEMFTESQQEYYEGLIAVEQKVENGLSASEQYTTKMNVGINPSEIFANVAKKLKNKYTSKLGEKSYYNENQYLKEFFEQDIMSVLFDYEPSAVSKTNTGYKLKPIMSYYDSALENLILFDNALLYYGKLDETKRDAMRDEYAQDIVTMHTIISDMLEGAENGGAVIGNTTLSDIASKLDSIVAMLGKAGSVIEEIKAVIEEIETTGKTPVGFTLAELKSINEKLSKGCKAYGDKDFDKANDEFADVIATVLNKMVDLAKEMGENGTLNGIDYREKLSSIPVINKIYDKFNVQIDDIIDKMATSGFVKKYTKESVLETFDIKRIEDIIIGLDTDERFTIDTFVDYIVPFIKDTKVDSPEHSADEIVIDQYKFKNVTMRRYLY